ncbi:unnamed protein product (macronuclear) [Paramecium tetraurelia]|uniref:Uncharacterized protein n=1 Tax=Paramecium tetraurelia TaxID=5888 RepID=A0BKV7_PARTE|nr:uncharacterized protein GSPATT00029805001 [Paramecium tetraurelia]CAK59174.1 unnamed protein product [Paramecium tetraurelia]|eukprot:XP_001426572.1 hypothetical protein (macronuclear) [Paramecium tetraurelia strain d4-2]
MDTRQFEAIPVQQRNTVKQQEDLYISLPDLYIRKYVLSEKLFALKKPYIPKVNMHDHTNQEILRVPKIWQQVMNDVQLKALDFQERKKWKIAVNYQLAQEAKATHQMLQKEREEIEQFGICISYSLCQMVQKAFNQMGKNQSIGLDIEEQNQKPIQKYLRTMKNENQELDEQRYQDALQKVKRYLSTNRDVYVSLESLFPDMQQTYSESNTHDIHSSDRRKIKQTVEFDFKKKYENLQEALQLFVNKDIPLKESFEKSVMSIESFPNTLEMIYKYKAKPYYQEPCLDPEYEELLFRIGCTPEQVLNDGEKLMKKMKIFQNNQAVEQQLPPQLELKDLFRYRFNYIERDCHFIQQSGKFVPLDAERFNSHAQQITKSNELVKQYFIYYYQKFQGDFNQISQALSSNTVTANLYLYTPNFCADLYAWLIFTKSIPSNSKFILPQQYQKKCESIKYIKKPQQPQTQYTNILNDYESLIQKKLPTKIQHLKPLPQHPIKQYTKSVFKELQQKIKFDDPIQVKTSGQADYSMVERLSFSNLKDLVKSVNNSKGHIEKRYKNIYDIARQDCYPIEQIKKEIRKNFKQQMASSRIFPVQQNNYNKATISQFQQKPPTIENFNSAQTILAQQQVMTTQIQQPLQQPQQQPLQQTSQQPLQQAPQAAQPPPAAQPYTPSASSRPRKTKLDTPAQTPQQPPPPVVQQPTSAKKTNRKKDDSVAQSTQAPTPANVETQDPPKQSKRTKKQTKANDKNKQQQPEDRKDDSV